MRPTGKGAKEGPSHRPAAKRRPAPRPGGPRGRGLCTNSPAWAEVAPHGSTEGQRTQKSERREISTLKQFEMFRNAEKLWDRGNKQRDQKNVRRSQGMACYGAQILSLSHGKVLGNIYVK